MAARAGAWLGGAHEIAPELAAWRESLHREPELSNQERRTREKLAAALRRLRVPFRSFADGFNGIVGTIDSGRPGPTILLRADMDALPVSERSGLSYASRVPGRMHACGHDVHMAALLGAARQLRDAPERWRGRVRLLFQPAEEEGRTGGAAPFIARGCLRDPRVDFVVGQHVEPSLPAGTVGWKAGVLFASADRFAVTVRGTGGHAATPHRGPDAVLVAAEIGQGLQSLVSRVRDPLAPAVVSVGMIHGGSRHNVLPEVVEIEGTVRTLDRPTRRLLQSALIRRVRHIADSLGASVSIGYVRGYPVTNNESSTTRRVAAGLIREFGSPHVRELARPLMGAEDFSRYLEKAPGTFLLLGAGTRQMRAPLHSSTFVPPEQSTITGAAALACAATTLGEGG